MRLRHIDDQEKDAPTEVEQEADVEDDDDHGKSSQGLIHSNLLSTEWHQLR